MNPYASEESSRLRLTPKPKKEEQQGIDHPLMEGKKLDMSRDELRSFTKAMADPKFKDMMEKSRSRAVEASDESQGFLSKILPTYKAGANKDFKRAIADFKNIPEYARDKEAYNNAGYKKGGSIRGGGIESRGKTKGRFV